MEAVASLRRALALLQGGDWQGAHRIVQDDASRQGAWLHGIVHILEGDMDNARYWYARSRRRFPAHAEADLNTELDEAAAAIDAMAASRAEPC